MQILIIFNSKNMFKRLFIEMSGKCIGKCPGCFSRSKDFFDINIFKTILEDSFEVGFNWIGFCGKDLLQHKQIQEILNLAFDIGFYVRIYTCLLSNNYKPNKNSNFNLKLDITFIVWGIPSFHDSYCGINNSFRDSCQKLLNWKKAGARVAAKYFPQENSKDNINELKQIFKELDIPLLICVWLTPLESEQYQNSFKPLSLNNAVNILKTHNKIFKYSYDLHKSPCKAGLQRAFITSNYILKACSVNEKPIADLTMERFKTIWNQDCYWGRWRKIKLMELNECCNCKYREFCHICPSSFIEKNTTICNNEKLKRAKSMYNSR